MNIQNFQDMKVLEFLLAHGASPEEKSNEGVSSLMLAALDGNMEIVKLLLPALKNPDSVYDKCFTPGLNAIKYAFFPRRYDIAREILKYFKDEKEIEEAEEMIQADLSRRGI